MTPRIKQSDIRVKLGEYDFEQVFLLLFHIRKSSELFSPLLFTGRWNEGPNFYACVNEDSWEIRRRHFRERYCNPQTERSRHKVRKDIDINFTRKTYLNSISYKESKAFKQYFWKGQQKKSTIQVRVRVANMPSTARWTVHK